MPPRFAFVRCALVLMAALAVAPVETQAARAEQWRRVTAPEFTLVTPLPEKEALAWAGEFSQFVAALQGFIPVDPRRLPRLTIVVFARDRDFAPFRPPAPDGKPKEAAGFFSRRESWAVAGLAGTSLSGPTRTTIFHEGTHWFLSGFELPNPVWLEEGLAEVFSTFTVDRRNMSWGRAIDDHVTALNVLQPMPLERLLFLAQSDLFTGGEEGAVRTGMAYAQSWAFVHYLLFGKRDLPPGALTQYVRTLRSETHPDTAFQKAFGRTYAEMDRELANYLRGGQYFVAKPPLATVAALRAEPATELEVADALARLCLAGGRRPEALAHAEKAVAVAPDAPQSFELLGQVYLEAGDRTKALAAFEQAVAKGSRDFRPYFELGRAKLEAAGEMDGAVHNLTPEVARTIAADYERAINANPRFRPAYQSLAGIVELLPADEKQHEPFLQLGLRLFPDDGMIRLGLAVLARKRGDETAANAMLAEVLNPERAYGTDARRYARRLETAWMGRDVLNEAKALADGKKFDEAIALVEKAMTETGDPALRRALQDARKNFQAGQRITALRTALEGRKWAEARGLMEEVLASDAPPMLKLQMRRQLEQLGQRGIEKAKATEQP